MGAASLASLGRIDEIDEFRESVIKLHSQNWRLLQAAGENYLNVEHSGFIVAGKFQRGPHRGGGKVVSSFERDRVRALQLMVQAMPLAAKDSNKSDVAGFYLAFARNLLSNRGHYEAWRLQYLADLATLPDYEEEIRKEIVALTPEPPSTWKAAHIKKAHCDKMREFMRDDFLLSEANYTSWVPYDGAGNQL